MTDERMEARLRAWYRSEAEDARLPVTLAEAVDRIPSSAGQPRWRLPRALTQRPAIALAAVAAVVVVAVVGLELGRASFIGGQGTPPAPTSDAPGAVNSPGADTNPGLRLVGPASYELPWPGGPDGARVQVAIPTGRAVWASGSTITMTEDGRAPEREDAGPPTLGIHNVSGIVDKVCAHSDPKRHLVEVGPTIDDLATALEAQQGWTDRSGPVDDRVGGYTARKYTFDLDFDLRFTCLDPAEGIMLWQDRDGAPFGALEGRQGTATVWIVDVDGHRLVLTTTDHLDVSTEAQRATRDAILGSLTISVPPVPSPSIAGARSKAEALPRNGVIEPGRYNMPWGTLQPYLTLPSGWISTDDGSTISKYDPDLYRPHLTLTVHEVEPFVAVDACTERATLVEALKVDEIVTALVELAGVERIGPNDVTIGGYPAKKLVLTLPSDRGCPGPEGGQGVVFMESGPRDFVLSSGSTGTIYVVDVGTGDGLVITTSALDAAAEDIAELESIVASITID